MHVHNALLTWLIQVQYVPLASSIVELCEHGGSTCSNNLSSSHYESMTMMNIDIMLYNNVYYTIFCCVHYDFSWRNKFTCRSQQSRTQCVECINYYMTLYTLQASFVKYSRIFSSCGVHEKITYLVKYILLFAIKTY